MIVIPAIDIYKDAVVRLTKGDFNSITYYDKTPEEQAELYASLGFKLIHVVDLLGSKSGELTASSSLKKIKQETGLKIEFGGGIRNLKTVSELFSAGADFAVIGSLSVKNKDEFELIVNRFSPEKIIAAVDAENEMLKVSGWTEDTKTSIYEHIEYCSGLGIKKFLCTDISKDGMLSGTNIELYKKIINRFPDIQLIASGGIKDINDIKKLAEINPFAVVVGKAIYEGKIDLKELAEFAV